MLAGVVLAVVFVMVALRPHPASTALIMVPRSDWSVQQDPSTSRATFTFEMRNTGDAPVTIVRAGRAGPGLRLLHTTGYRLDNPDPAPESGGEPLPLRPDGHALGAVSLVYRVSGCSGGHRGSGRIPVTYRIGGSTPHTVLVTPGSAAGRPAWREVLTHGRCPAWTALIPNGGGGAGQPRAGG